MKCHLVGWESQWYSYVGIYVDIPIPLQLSVSFQEVLLKEGPSTCVLLSFTYILTWNFTEFPTNFQNFHKPLGNAGIITYAHELDLVRIQHLSQSCTCSSRPYVYTEVNFEDDIMLHCHFHNCLISGGSEMLMMVLGSRDFLWSVKWVQFSTCVLLSGESLDKHHLLQSFFKPKRLKSNGLLFNSNRVFPHRYLHTVKFPGRGWFWY